MIRLPGSPWRQRRRPHVTVRLRWLGQLVSSARSTWLGERLILTRNGMRWRA